MALKGVAGRAKSSVNANAFAGQTEAPTEKQLAAVLRDCHRLWRGLVTDLREELAVDTAEWHTSSVKLGWSLRLQVKKRNIVYLGPREGWFLASFILGDKAIAVARKSRPGSLVLKMISESKRYPEGTAVRIEVHSEHDLLVVKQLAKIKIEN
jgi:Protein of unknown function (DUF3788)